MAIRNKRPTRSAEPESFEGSGVFGSGSRADRVFNSRKFNPTNERPLTVEEAPEIAELGPEGSMTILHNPRTHESYQNRARCDHSMGFKVDQVNLKSKMIDELCEGCGFGRVRGMTLKEVRHYSRKQKPLAA